MWSSRIRLVPAVDLREEVQLYGVMTRGPCWYSASTSQYPSTICNPTHPRFKLGIIQVLITARVEKLEKCGNDRLVIIPGYEI